jgi:hypothetical protein
LSVKIYDKNKKLITGTTITYDQTLNNLILKPWESTRWDLEIEKSELKNDYKITLKIGEKYLYFNGKTIELEAPSKIISGTTLVPLRAISEAFGCTVAYGRIDEAVTISVRSTN